MDEQKTIYSIDIEELRYFVPTQQLKCKEETFREMITWWKENFPNNTKIVNNNDYMPVNELLFLDGTIDELVNIKDKLVEMNAIAFRVEAEKVVKEIEKLIKSCANFQRWRIERRMRKL